MSPGSVSVCSGFGRSSRAPLPWLSFFWASRASLSGQELTPSPADASPSRLRVSLQPFRAGGLHPFSLFLRRQSSPVLPSPGRLSSFRRPPPPSRCLDPGPGRRVLPGVPGASAGGSAPGGLQPPFPWAVGFWRPPGVPWLPEVAGSKAALALWAFPRPCRRSGLGAPSALADPDSCSPEAGLPGPSWR